MDSNKVHYRALPRLFRRQRLLIIGCGDIGQRVAVLSSSHWRVFGIGRSEQTLDRIRATGATALAAPEPGAAARRRRLQDLAAWVVHSAPPPTDSFGRDGVAIDRLTRAWTARLLQALHSRRRGPSVTAPRRLVYLSTTGVYGDRQGRLTDETSVVLPLTDRARRRVDAEQWLRKAARACAGLQVTTLRVPGIYAIDRLPIGRLRDRLPVLLPQDDVRTNHIHADDLARLTRVALLRGRTQRTFNVVDDSALPMGDYFDMVARWAGLPTPPRVDRQTLLGSVSPMRASFMSESRQLSNLRMKRELKLVLRFPTVAQFLASNAPPQAAARPRAQEVPPI